jgi:hypothetical protein
MKFILILISATSLSFAAVPDTIVYSRGTIYVAGPKANRQIYHKLAGRSMQLTHFEPGETVGQLFLSNDESSLLIIHWPKHRRGHCFSVLDLNTLSMSKSITPGVRGQLFWTKHNTVLWLYKNFRLYDKRLNVLAKPDAGFLEEFLEQDIIVSVPEIDPDSGRFQVWSLKDGRLLTDTSLVSKYGMYDFESVKCVSGKLTVRLLTREASTIVVDTLEY